MKVTETRLKGLLIIEPAIHKDGRGYFFESYNRKRYHDNGIDIDFVQDNQSVSHRGTVRGLHSQEAPYTQAKLVRVIQGRVIDVAVDVRKDSPTYGQYETIELSGENQIQFLIPEGFLHGFSVLEDNTIFAYKVNRYYSKEGETGVIWNDPTLNIDWGIAKEDAIISPKDELLPTFAEYKSPF